MSAHVNHCCPPSLAVKRGVAYIVCLCLVMITSGCTREEAADATVSWPELVRFDEISYRADGLARAGDTDALDEARSELIEAGRAITPETIPSNAADRQQVETILADLASLIDGLSADIDDQSMSSLVLGLHPVVERLMAAAGMPHVHASEGPNHGFLHPIFDGEGKQVGTAEISLHHGDLQVWLTRGGHGGEPWQLPIDTTLSLSFPDLGQEITLAAGDREPAEGESGATAHFVLVGHSGADASWLNPSDFAAKAELRFDDATTGSFVLRAHCDHDHNHDHGDHDHGGG